MLEKAGKSEYSDKEQLDAWIEWKKICQLKKCSDTSKKILYTKGDYTYRKLLNVRSIRKDYIPFEVGWTYFEYYAVENRYKRTGHRNLGKSYKDGIFFDLNSKEDPPLKILNGIFSSMLRSVVNNSFSEEMRSTDFKKREESLNKILKEDSGMTLEDLLPDGQGEGDIYTDPDLKRIASTKADECFEMLSFNEKVLFFAELNKLKRSDSFILDFLKTNTSQVSDVLNKYIPRKIKSVFPAEMDESELMDFFHMIIEQLKVKILSYLKSEKPALPFLNYIEQKKSNQI